MTLLSRYVARQFLTTWLAMVLGLPLLFVITELTEKIDTYLDRGLGLGTILHSYLYAFPQFLYFSFPIAALVAAVFTVGGMTRHQELTAAKAGGVSFGRIVTPLLLLGVVLSAAGIGLGELVPLANERRAVMLREGNSADLSRVIRTNFVFQTEGGPTLSVRRLDAPTRSMTGVTVEQAGGDDLPGVFGTAETAIWNRQTGWTLQNGYVRMLPPKSTERTFRFASLRLPAVHETPEQLLAEPKDPDLMRYREISQFAAAIERSGGDARELLTEQAQKIALPIATLVIILFGAPLATSSQRGGTAFGVGISLAITLIYLLLFRIGEAMGTAGVLAPWMAAWFPNLLFFLGGTILLARTRT